MVREETWAGITWYEVLAIEKAPISGEANSSEEDFGLFGRAEACGGKRAENEGEEEMEEKEQEMWEVYPL